MLECRKLAFKSSPNCPSCENSCSPIPSGHLSENACSCVPSFCHSWRWSVEILVVSTVKRLTKWASRATTSPWSKSRSQSHWVWKRSFCGTKCSRTRIANCPCWEKCFGSSQVATLSASAAALRPSQNCHSTKRTWTLWCRWWRGWGGAFEGCDWRPCLQSCLCPKLSSCVPNWRVCKSSSANLRPIAGGPTQILGTRWRSSPSTWITSHFQQGLFQMYVN